MQRPQASMCHLSAPGGANKGFRLLAPPSENVCDQLTGVGTGDAYSSKNPTNLFREEQIYV